jgi:hypothetical protein
MYKYFVVVETEKYGYILGACDTYDSAFKLYTKSEHYFNYTSGAIDRGLTKLKKYKLNNDPYINRGDLFSSSTGIISIYLIEIGIKWKSIEHFIADREYIPVFPKDAELRN